jgi:hypothetical protein
MVAGATMSRREREQYLESLIERYTAGQEPLQAALTIVRLFREVAPPGEEWAIECSPDRYRVVRREPL